MSNSPLVECVPNFSEGRRSSVVESLVSAAAGVAGVKVLDWSRDADHNRCVLTLLGPPERLFVALDACFDVAVEHMPIDHHQGQHPRIGAVDVVPFIPIEGCTMDDCVGWAHRYGYHLVERYDVPVYFYEYAALKPERRNLAHVRRGSYEGLRNTVHLPERAPDAGPARLHPRLGAVAVGARKLLVAYNVNLGTDRIEVADSIVKRIRARNGGLMGVKAMPVRLVERGIVQVSMNLIDYTQNAMYTVFELVKMEAQRWGVPVVGSEVIGLLPTEALLEVARYYLRLENFASSRVLESHLRSVEEPI